MKIAIIGFGTEGRAAYDYWQSGNEITICDQKTDLQTPDGVATQLGENYLANLEQFDLIVRSPFVRPDTLLSAASVDILPKMTSNTNEFMRVCPSRNIIGVTGTKGKGTTSTLTAKMLEAAGLRVHLGGNIGTAALDLLKNDIRPDDWVVLELSSYQLIDLRQSPHIAACLMVMPEHLDWHENLEEYFAAKQQLFRRQTADDIAVFYPANQNSTAIATAGAANKIPYTTLPGAVIVDGGIQIDNQLICDVSELKLLGEHNWQNVCAATTIVWQITEDVAAIRAVLTSFAGLPFRIEFRQEVNGIRYYNDSYATGQGATIAAMQAIPETKVMILGGYDRGIDLSELAEALIDKGDNVRACLIIGASQERLATTLRSHGYNNFKLSGATTMPDIVREASNLAQPGDAVVLSPAFASFGLFKNFEDRGLQFNETVKAL